MSEDCDDHDKSIWHKMFCKCKGCTGVPEGPFYECCVKHDEDYEKGGSHVDRKEADKRFLACMLARRKWKPVAYTYYWGVRVFGAFFYKHKK
jgi:hypothetical protein